MFLIQLQKLGLQLLIVFNEKKNKQLSFESNVHHVQFNW